MARRSYNMSPKNSFKAYCCLLVISILFIITGIVLLILRDFIFSAIIKSSLHLSPTSKSFDIWKKSPFPIGIDFYFFNWTNPEDVYDNSTKPRFQQIGPYHFLEVKEKVNLTWNANGTVTYKHMRKWYFDGKSNLLDQITTVNPVALAAAYTARDWSFLMKKGISVTLRSFAPNIHITRSVGQMLFEGYDDPLINMGRSMPFVSNIPPWDKFGWFYTRNGSREFDGIFNMGTGDKTVLGKLYNWKYKNHTGFYDDGCGNINGSAGELFSPNPQESISFFSSDLCRTITLDFVGQTNVNNIIGNKYSAGTSLLDNGTLVPDNSCFCEGECIPSGAINVSTCRYGSPAFASLPHFYNADPYYVNLIDGLSPDRKKHEFFITLEPNTGIPLEVSARLQINLLLQPISSIALYEHAPKAFVPMVWFQQVVKIPNNMTFNIKLLLNLPVICIAIGVLAICIGLVTMVCMIYKICTINICGKKKKEQRTSYHEQVPLNIEEKGSIFKKQR